MEVGSVAEIRKPTGMSRRTFAKFFKGSEKGTDQSMEQRVTNPKKGAAE